MVLRSQSRRILLSIFHDPSRICTVNSRALADRYCHSAVATGDAFDHCPLYSAAVGSWFYRPLGANRGDARSRFHRLRLVSRRRKSVGYWPLAIDNPTHSGARSWAGNRLSLGVTVDG